MSKKDEAADKKICMNCKHRKLPSGQLPIRGWCGNPKSQRYDGYIYKGDTCPQFKSKVSKGKGKE